MIINIHKIKIYIKIFKPLTIVFVILAFVIPNTSHATRIPCLLLLEGLLKWNIEKIEENEAFGVRKVVLTVNSSDQSKKILFRDTEDVQLQDLISPIVTILPMEVTGNSETRVLVVRENSVFLAAHVIGSIYKILNEKKLWELGIVMPNQTGKPDIRITSAEKIGNDIYRLNFANFEMAKILKAFSFPVKETDITKVTKYFLAYDFEPVLKSQ